MEPYDLLLIKQALLECHPSTQQFLQPMLGSPAVQQLLLTIIQDPSDRTMDDWVFDPIIRQRLEVLRSQYIDSEGNTQTHAVDTINTLYQKKSKAVADEQTVEEMSMEQILEQAQHDKQLANEKFKNGDYYSAISSYRRIVDKVSRFLPVEDSANDDPIHQVYISCCTNIAVAALKASDATIAVEYAMKTLRVEPTHVKAMYCKSKGFLLQHRYTEARGALDEALDLDPTNPSLVRLQLHIARVEEKMNQRKPAKPLTPAPIVQKKPKYNPLPRKHNPKKSILSALNEYIGKSQNKFTVEFKRLGEPSDPHLFECLYSKDGVEVGRAQAPSKKKAQHEAARLCVEYLWEEATAKTTLLPEDIANQKLDAEEATKEVIEIEEKENTMPLNELEPIYLTNFEKLQQPQMVLNNLAVKYPLSIRIEFEDLSIEDDTKFECTIFANGVRAGFGTSTSKKKAKKFAATEALAYIVACSLENEKETN